MIPRFQSKQSVTIHAPLNIVWEYNQDLSKIALYHPRVKRVDLISNKRFRETGVAYQCHLADGKNTCIEKDIEIIPYEKIVTVFINDTMGLTKLLPDYTVESCVFRIDNNSTRVDISHFYSSSRWKVRLLNFIIRPKIARETQAMLEAMKNIIENEYSDSK